MEKLWKKLTSISTLEFKAICRKIPPSYETRKGKGKVLIQNKDEETITFFEKGTWCGVQNQNHIAFTNVFRWRLDRDLGHLSLEHLRFGIENPVFLFTLIPIEDNLFKSLEPHECKEDSYFGKLLFADHYIHLNWRIIGPSRNEVLEYYYC